MSHFAEINENNVVIRVVVGNDSKSNEGLDWIEKNLGGTWVKTSYNGRIRKRFAAIGYFYDKDRDAFIPPKPFDSWLLNEETCLWEAQIPYPRDNKQYSWEESTTSWIEIPEEITGE